MFYLSSKDVHFICSYNIVVVVVPILVGIFHRSISNVFSIFSLSNCILFLNKKRSITSSLIMQLLNLYEVQSLPGDNPKLQVLCTALSELHLQQLLFHVLYCFFTFVSWLRETYYWYIFGVNFVVLFIELLHFFVHNVMIWSLEFFVPHDMQSKIYLQQLIRLWNVYAGYFCFLFFVTIALWVFSRFFFRCWYWKKVVFRYAMKLCEMVVGMF